MRGPRPDRPEPDAVEDHGLAVTPELVEAVKACPVENAIGRPTGCLLVRA